MVLNKYKSQILAEYVKDMYTAGMTSKYGAYTEKANIIHRRIRGRGFTNFFVNCLLHLDTASETSIIDRLNEGVDTGIWLSKATLGLDGWTWHYFLPEMNDEKFLELINDNRKLYGLSASQYTQSEMAKAARLLDDEMQYEI
jgi:hypothetical protein